MTKARFRRITRACRDVRHLAPLRRREAFLRNKAFLRDEAGSSAVEFAIISVPFVLVLLFILQMGIYYAAQSSLNAGVIQAADGLVNSFNSGTTPNTTTLKAVVYARSGGLIHNDATLLVELVTLSSLNAAVIPIGSTATAGAPGVVLALRAQASITTFMPGFATLATIRASTLIRRQGT